VTCHYGHIPETEALLPRPRKTRLIQCDAAVRYYKPRGIPLLELVETVLSLDGLEALRLADVEGLDQDEAARRMGISRSTFSRVIGEARRAVATALTRGWAIRIEGGPVELSPPRGQRRVRCSVPGAAAPSRPNRRLAANKTPGAD
jgi:uncharacterized protein